MGEHRIVAVAAHPVDGDVAASQQRSEGCSGLGDVLPQIDSFGVAVFDKLTRMTVQGTGRRSARQCIKLNGFTRTSSESINRVNGHAHVTRLGSVHCSTLPRA